MWIQPIANGHHHGRQSLQYIDNHDNHAFLKVYLYIFILISTGLPWLSSVFLATNSTNNHLSDSLQPFPPPPPLQCCYKFSLARRKIRRRFSLSNIVGVGGVRSVGSWMLEALFCGTRWVTGVAFRQKTHVWDFQTSVRHNGIRAYARLLILIPAHGHPMGEYWPFERGLIPQFVD